MTEQEVKKQIANAFRDVADKIDATLDAISKPPQPETSEAAQAAHEAELKAFNTKGGQSLNSATPGTSIEDLLKQEKPKE